MTQKLHTYNPTIRWKADPPHGTIGYKSYSRNHEIVVEGKPIVYASSDAAFRGDINRHTPEELMVASLSSCHMLWFLHLCATNGVVVVEYTDTAYGEMREDTDGGGAFQRVTLFPKVTITDSSMSEKAQSLHDKAHELCFIARSVNFPVDHKSEVRVTGLNQLLQG